MMNMRNLKFVIFFSAALLNLNSYAQNQNAAIVGKRLPVVAFALNEKENELFVLPADVQIAMPQTSLTLKPGVMPPTKSIGNVVPDLNSLTTPLSERLGLFAGHSLKTIKLNTEWNGEWAKAVLQFINGSAALKEFTANKEVWPPAAPFASSILGKKEGLILFFSFRNSEKTSVLEKIDFIQFRSGRTSRYYWTRELNDPGLKLSATVALDKVIETFNKTLLISTPDTEVMDGLKFYVSKKVKERDLAQLESFIKTFKANSNKILVPYDISKEEIRFTSSIPKTSAGEILEKIKAGNAPFFARVVPSDAGIIQILPLEQPQKK